jgi:hypothetical protein
MPSPAMSASAVVAAPGPAADSPPPDPKHPASRTQPVTAAASERTRVVSIELPDLPVAMTRPIIAPSRYGFSKLEPM